MKSKLPLLITGVLCAIAACFLPRYSYGRYTNFQKALDKEISGKISDENGNALTGVTVAVKGTTTGTVTNSEGVFTIHAEKGQIIVFSYIGYETKEIEYEGQGEIDVVLKSTSMKLDEFVAIGFATQKQSDITSSISNIAGEDLRIETSNNIQQTMQGKIPGLMVQEVGAGPGRSNIHMNIRGVTTIGNNEPLVIVDGIEQPMAFINPDDIESISVLKDAASTAIYGSRAAKGVILITTKSAKAGKVAVSYDGFIGFRYSNNTPKHMGLKDYLDLENIAWINSTGAPIRSEQEIQEYIEGNKVDKIHFPDVNDWYDYMLSVAPQISNSIAINGGSEAIKTRLSVRDQYEGGILPHEESRLDEIRLNSIFQVNSKISISADINYRFQDTKAPFCENCVINQMLQNSQFIVPRYPDGSYGVSSDGKSPLVQSDLAGSYREKKTYLSGILSGDWEIIRGLKVSVQYGVRSELFNSKNHENSYSISEYENPDNVLVNHPINSLNEVRNILYQTTLNNTLNYENSFGKNNLNVLLGYSQIENKQQDLSAYRRDFPNNDLGSLNMGADNSTKNNSGRDYGWGLRSYFGRFSYDFAGKYLMQGNIRYDGSSRFGGKNKYGLFPSVSLGWRTSEEGFWNSSKLKEVINDLKLRGSWGEAGNQAVDLYSFIPRLDPVTYSFGGVPFGGFIQTVMSNEDLSWETNESYDIGLDMQFLNGRIEFTTDYYNKKTRDILLTLPVPSVLGLLPAPQNAGKVLNKGWEFSLVTHHQMREFSLNTSFNFNINTNKVLDLAGTGPYISSGNETRFITQVGLPLNAMWGYRTDGYLKQADIDSHYPKFQDNMQPGDVKFLDLNGDGQITSQDMAYLGRSFPKYTFGGSLNLNYKNFTLDLFFQGVSGVKARIGGAIIEMGIWEGFTSEIVTDNYWTPDRPNARFPRPLKYDLRNINMADRDLQNGAYFRLKNVRLSYSIPNRITAKIGIDGLSVYGSITNLFTLSALNDWFVDPESPVGTRTENYPPTSVATFGVHLNF